MKTKLRQLLTLGIALVSMVSVHGHSFLTNGLVAYYPFNGNVNDVSGNGNTGAPIDVTFGTDRFGVASKCALFNGTSSVIDVATLNSFQYRPVTYSVWFKLSAFPPPTTSTGPAAASVMNLIGRERSYDAAEGAITLFSQTGIMTNEMIYYTSDGSRSYFNPRTNTWYQLGMTIEENQTLSWYLNGKLIRSATFTAPQSSQFAFRIGASAAPLLAWSPRYHWNGAIDDIRIYNRAFSSNEVASLYHYESQRSNVQFIKMYTLDYDGLSLGTNYQLQVSTNVLSWANWGSPFTATSERYTNAIPIQRVDDWGKIFFRLVPQ